MIPDLNAFTENTSHSVFSLTLISTETPALDPTAYWTTNSVWVCFCSPLDPHPPRAGTSTEQEPSPFVDAESNLFLACFHSQHSRDMRLQEAQDR